MTHHFHLHPKTSPQGASRHLWCFRAGSGRRRCGEVGGVQGLVVSEPFLNQSNGIKVTLTSRFRYRWFLLEDRHGLASVAYVTTESAVSGCNVGWSGVHTCMVVDFLVFESDENGSGSRNQHGRQQNPPQTLV